MLVYLLLPLLPQASRPIILWPLYGHVFMLFTSQVALVGVLPRPFLATQLALQLGLAEALVPIYYPLSLIPFPARDLAPIWALAGGYQPLPNRAKLGPGHSLI